MALTRHGRISLQIHELERGPGFSESLIAKQLFSHVVPAFCAEEMFDKLAAHWDGKGVTLLVRLVSTETDGRERPSPNLAPRRINDGIGMTQRFSLIKQAFFFFAGRENALKVLGAFFLVSA